MSDVVSINLGPRLNAIAKLPYGSAVKFRKKGQSAFQPGRLSLVWLAMDEVCLNVVLDDGSNIGVIPGLGDDIEGAG